MSTDAAFTSASEVYWNDAADTYEEKFSGTSVGRARRQAVWRDMERLFRPGDRILELNCGTGIDAVFLAGKGIHVVACDISPRMIELANHLAETAALANRPDFRVLATEKLSTLQRAPPFDGAFSNFAGFNCVEDLSLVARDLAPLLKPGAPLLLNILGRFVPWEIAWFLAHGNPRQAFLRVHQYQTFYEAGGGFSIQRPTVAQITRHMSPHFRLRGWKGIGITVPPSYMEHQARRFPRLIERLAAIDQRIGSIPLLRNMADCVVLEFERSHDGV